MKFGQYELLERIAVGGMAEVYRGRVAGAEGFEKLVAIKRVLPEFARDERFISMLLTEARIHSALSHRNIVQIHDLGISEDGEYFIVLEYVEGHDLRAVMEAATALGVQIPDSLALHIAYELAQALHFAHELRDAEGHPLGIVHRDVSPSNVLLSNSGEVKLSDFGIAKRQRDHSVVGSLKGNLVYMSPEQARKGPLDRRTDVFSLGAVLFEMLTGQKPREITNEVDGWREVVSGGVRSARGLRPDMPDAYEALLARAMASDPNDRYPDAAIFGGAIRELLRESEAPAGPNDIKELIEVLDPPRHARSPVERSKVIRLGPEFKLPAMAGSGQSATSGAGGRSGAPADQPTPVAGAGISSSKMPPPAPWPGAAALAAPPVPPAGREAVTPPPVPNFSKRGRTDLGLGKLLRPELFPEAQPPSPGRPPGAVVSGAGAPVAGSTAPPGFAGGQPTPPPVATGSPTPPLIIQPPAPVPPPPPSFMAPPAMVVAPAPSMMPASINGSSANGSSGRGYGAPGLVTPPLADSGMPTPPPVAPELEAAGHDDMPIDVGSFPTPPPTPAPVAPMTAYPPSGQHFSGGVIGQRAGAPFSGPTGAAPFAAPYAEPYMGSAPVVMPKKRSGFPFVQLLAVLVLLAGGAAAYVHLQVMPLPVLLVWNKPASLQIASDPAGAEVTLDGRPTSVQTPARLAVKRDRSPHEIVVSKPGFESANRTVRFDKTPGALAETFTLKALPPPPEPAKVDPPKPEPVAEAKAPEPEPDTKAKTGKKEGKKEDKKAKAAKKGRAAKKGKKARK